MIANLSNILASELYINTDMVETSGAAIRQLNVRLSQAAAAKAEGRQADVERIVLEIQRDMARHEEWLAACKTAREATHVAMQPILAALHDCPPCETLGELYGHHPDLHGAPLWWHDVESEGRRICAAHPFAGATP